MKDKLIEFETAKLAKEKGFDEYCDISWRTISSKMDANKRNSLGDTYTAGSGAGPIGVTIFTSIYAPTQSLLQHWLREVHDLDVYVIPNGSRDKSINKRLYHPQIWVKDKYQTELHSKYSYEDALEKGLQEALKLIK